MRQLPYKTQLYTELKKEMQHDRIWNTSYDVPNDQILMIIFSKYTASLDIFTFAEHSVSPQPFPTQGGLSQLALSRFLGITL